MAESSTTSNGHEIRHPREVMSSTEFKELVTDYGLSGATPKDRLNNLKGMPKEQLAYFMADINRRAQGSEETLVSDETVKIGGESTIASEHRYDLFSSIIDKIHATPEDINPARVGDTLALATVILHPFHDGNGRTARLLGLVFNEDFNNEDFEESYNALVEPRDVARERGGMIIYGYVPQFKEGNSRNDPRDVEGYFESLLTSESVGAYTGPYGQASLNVPQSS